MLEKVKMEDAVSSHVSIPVARVNQMSVSAAHDI